MNFKKNKYIWGILLFIIIIFLFFFIKNKKFSNLPLKETIDKDKGLLKEINLNISKNKIEFNEDFFVIKKENNKNVLNNLGEKLSSKLHLFNNGNIKDSDLVILDKENSKILDYEDLALYNSLNELEEYLKYITKNKIKDKNITLEDLNSNLYFVKDNYGLRNNFYNYLFEKTLNTLKFESKKEDINNTLNICNIIKQSVNKDEKKDNIFIPYSDNCYYKVALVIKNKDYCENIVSKKIKEECILYSNRNNDSVFYKKTFGNIENCLLKNKNKNTIMYRCFINFYTDSLERFKSVYYFYNKGIITKNDFNSIKNKLIYSDGEKNSSICSYLKKNNEEKKSKECFQNYYTYKCSETLNKGYCNNIEDIKIYNHIKKMHYRDYIENDLDKSVCDLFDDKLLNEKQEQENCFNYYYYYYALREKFIKKGNPENTCKKIKEKILQKNCIDIVSKS